MIPFDGEELFPAVPPAGLYPKLSDAGFLAGCLPDADLTEATPDRAAWKLKPRLAFMAGAIETTLVVANRVPGEAVAFTVHGNGVGATSTVETALTLRPADGGTAVHWTADITALTGLLKMVPKGLIQATARTVIRDVWAAVRAKIERGPVTP
jgi:carbon monoxide dehydrogenase subunit G